MKKRAESTLLGSKTDIYSVFGFIYMNITIRSKLMKHILKHLNKVSSEPENMTEKIIQIKRYEVMEIKDRILRSLHDSKI